MSKASYTFYSVQKCLLDPLFVLFQVDLAAVTETIGADLTDAELEVEALPVEVAEALWSVAEWATI